MQSGSHIWTGAKLAVSGLPTTTVEAAAPGTSKSPEAIVATKKSPALRFMHLLLCSVSSAHRAARGTLPGEEAVVKGRARHLRVTAAWARLVTTPEKAT